MSAFQARSRDNVSATVSSLFPLVVFQVLDPLLLTSTVARSMDSSYSSSVDGEVASTSLKLPETAAALPQPESQMSDQSADENLVCQLLEGPDAEMFDLEVNEKPLDDKTPTTDALDAPANNVIGLSETSTKDMKNESFSTVDAPPSNVAPHEMENTTSDGRESTLNLSASKASISLVIETPADEPMEVDEDTAALALSTHPQPERDSANPQTDVNLPDNYPPVVYPAIDQTNGRVEIEQAPVESPKPEDADDGDKSTDEGEDDCTSSEVSEGVDFQVCPLLLILPLLLFGLIQHEHRKNFKTLWTIVISLS